MMCIRLFAGYWKRGKNFEKVEKRKSGKAEKWKSGKAEKRKNGKELHEYNYYNDISLIKKFLFEESGGYTFAVSDNFYLTDEINRLLQQEADNRNIPLKQLNSSQQTDTPLGGLLQEASIFSKALIVNNISVLIDQNPQYLQEFNFIREIISDLKIPVLFWLTSEKAALIFNFAPDLYSQRSYSTVVFEKTPQAPVPTNEISQRFEKKFISQEEYQRIKLRIQLLEQQIKDAREIQTPVLQIFKDLVIPLAELYSNLDLHQNSLQLLDQYKKDLQLPDNADLIITVADVYNKAGQIDNAEKLYLKAIPLSANNKRLSGYVCQQLGNLYSNIGDSDKALKYFEERLRLGKELHESNPQNVAFKNGLAIAYEKLGETHTSIGNLDKALKYFEQDLQLTKELHESNPQNVDFKNGLAIAYEKLGVTHTSIGNSDKALKYFEDETQLFEELHESNPQNIAFKNGLAISYSKLGHLNQHKKGDKKTTNSCFLKAQKLWKDLSADSPDYVEFQKNLEWVNQCIKQN